MSIGVLINHTISFLTSPIAVSLALIMLGVVMGVWRSRSNKKATRSTAQHSTLNTHCFSSLIPRSLIVLGILWLWFMSTDLAYRWLGMGLEREFPPVRVEDLPNADAIVVLGGGVGANTNTTYYTELYGAADRLAHAARIWKACKASVIIPSGKGELNAALPFLKELGVPESAIMVENESCNTEENAKFIAAFVSQHHHGNGRPRLIVVTSAWHMKRALLMFDKLARKMDVIPGACDYEATIHSDRVGLLGSIIPNADSLLRNSYMLKEYIGYFGYKFLRK